MAEKGEVFLLEQSIVFYRSVLETAGDLDESKSERWRLQCEHSRRSDFGNQFLRE